MHTGLATVNVDGTGLTRLTESAAFREYPRWSPDGSKIAYSGDDPVSAGDEEGGAYDIWVMDADGSNHVNVSNQSMADGREPYWSPDGSKIVYRLSGEGSNLVVMDADGLNQTPLGTSSDVNPAWSGFIVPAVTGEQAVVLDGVDDYIEVADSAALQPSSSMTVEAWFNTTQAVGDYTTLASKWHTDGTNASYTLGWTTAGGLGFSVDVAGTKVTASTGALYNDGLWHHVAGVWNFGTGFVYVDGELAGTGPGLGSTISTTSLPFIIGGDASQDGSRFFAGLVDEVRLWGVVRSAFEIRQDMVGAVEPTASGLVGYWDFNDGAAADLTANGNDGVLMGGAVGQLIPLAEADASYALGTVDVGAGTAPTAITITNAGDADLTLTSVSTPDTAHFTVTATGLPEVIAPGGTSAASITASFSPDRPGGEITTLEFGHDARGAVRVRLSGVGRSTTAPTGSLDNTKIAFVRSVGTESIYVADPDGSNEVRLTDDTADDWNPAWSPDGSQIAFQTDRDGNEEIYVMNADGTSQGNLTNYNGGGEEENRDITPEWSPDGSKIVFVSDRDGTRHMYLMNPDGSGQTRVTTTTGIVESRPTWSPDGQRLVFSFYDDVYVLATVNVDGSGLTILTESPEYREYPRWSPDGAKIVFSGEDFTQSGGEGGYRDIWVMNADGSGHVNLTNTATGTQRDPYWSPDGSRIVYRSEPTGETLVIIDPDGANPTPLGMSGDNHPTWSGFMAVVIAEQALTLDGVDDYVSVPDSAEIDFVAGDAFTVASWINTPAPASATAIVSKRDTAGDMVGYEISVVPPGYAQVALVAAGGATSLVGSTIVADDLWHHVAVAFDGTAVNLYVDGVLDATLTDAAYSNGFSNSSELRIGTTTTVEGAAKLAG
jgi:Tol biopolymer transport system component